MLHTINLQVDFNQLLSMINQCDQNQKLEIVKALEKDTFKARFKELLFELEENNLTADEITKEVEIVRKKRYNSKNQPQ